MRYFKKEKLEKAIKETYLEVEFGKVEHQETVVVRSVLTNKRTTGQVEA